MADQFKVLVICGSLRKGSFNAAVDARLAGAGAAGDGAHGAVVCAFPIYNVDDQNASGIPARPKLSPARSAPPTA